MKTSDFFYELPEQLIAQYPKANRTDSRLLHVQRDPVAITDRQFRDFADLLQPNDVLVFNNARVIPARLFGNKATGGKVEILIERITTEHSAIAHVRASKTPKAGSEILIHVPHSDSPVRFIVRDRQDSLFIIDCPDHLITDVLEQAGHMPLPPYIAREDDQHEQDRYQTVYAEEPGAVAAPTAGLHFDEEILERIRDRGIQSAYVTLHVGAGTFTPVRVDNIEEHAMHSEFLVVPEETVQRCKQAREQGGRIVAIGTTAVRSLETASQDGELKAFSGETDIFIYPGYSFNSVDALLTNFHLPESTLLMLVCAFAGYDTTMHAYRHAVEQKYRFFSYGDAMFIS